MSPGDLAWMNPRMSDQPWATALEPVAFEARRPPPYPAPSWSAPPGDRSHDAVGEARGAGLELPRARPAARGALTGPAAVAELLERIAREELQ